MSRVLRQLGEETRSFHRDVDAERFATLDRPTPYRYWTYLRQAYGIEAPSESAFALTAGLDSLIDLRAREKSGLIANDLLALGASPALIARLPLCRAISTFDSVPEALGWMYVNERGAMQHSALLRDVRAHVGTCSYLSAYSNGVMTERWAELGDVVDHVATTRAVVDEIVSAARDAFRLQREWFRQEQRDECLA